MRSRSVILLLAFVAVCAGCPREAPTENSSGGEGAAPPQSDSPGGSDAVSADAVSADAADASSPVTDGVANSGINNGGSGRISEEKAEAIALKAVPGQITEVAIEKKLGADRYVIEMIAADDGVETDVIIDLDTGEVLAVEK